MKTLRSLLFLLLIFFVARANAQTNVPLKKRSAFYTTERIEKIRTNLRQHPSGTALANQALERASFWLKLSDDEIWDLMFGATIPRSWMVWSNGDCPSCKKPVPMYKWIMDPKKHPWKTQCPQCEEFFPKNDFHSFYRSGLNQHGVFDPQKANRDLLFNAEHPDPKHPLHKFGVDDGIGYVEGDKRWRFIGAYLVYGQFKQLVLEGAKSLAVAHVLTGNPDAARKAAILLDRVADVYPDFDYAKQGLVYETGGHGGYVSVWHDACEETRELVLAYDQIFEAAREDEALVKFLARKADAFQLPNRKNTFADVQRNIEGGILRNALTNPGRIHSNFPRAECTIAMIHTVLNWPDNRGEVETIIDRFVKQATAVDGVTGEKGLSGYSSFTISGMANFLAEFARAEPDFLRALLQRVPSLRQTYRFHIDTLCLDRFYPNSGDAGSAGRPIDRYVGAHFNKLENVFLNPSMFSFFWQLYEATGDPDYVKILYRENKNTTKGLPHDLHADDPERFRDEVAKVIRKHGAEIKLSSINKEQWHLAILRSGEGANARAVVLDYDTGGAHSHSDGMNLGLFAHGMDLLPDFGYPPVQYGGWETPRANWYKMTASHNTAMVDRRNQNNGAGKTTLWADGKQFHAVRASAPQLTGGKQFERTIGLIDISEKDFYVVDVFRIVGGTEHSKFVYGPFGEITTSGLALEPAAVDLGPGLQLRDFQHDAQAKPGWNTSWKIEDQYDASDKQIEAGLRYTDFSSGVEAITSKAWLAPIYNSKSDAEVWISSVTTRRKGDAPLASTFVGVLEPFAKKSAIKSMRRLPLTSSEGESLSDANVAIEIQLADGRTDLIIAVDSENPLKLISSGEDGLLIQTDSNLQSNGELTWVRRDKRGDLERAVICRGSRLMADKSEINLPEKTDFAEFEIKNGRAIRISN